MKTLTLVFQIGLLLILCSCNKPKIAPSTLSPADAQTLKASFERLDKVLASKAASIHTNLAPPASDTEIGKLRAALSGNKIEVLEAWYKWHDGISAAHPNLLPLGYPFSIAESLEDRRMMQSIPFVDKLRKAAIKIMDDGSGDGFFIDVTRTNPLVFYHMLEDPTPRYYGSMSEFVDFIASGFESDAVFVNEAGEFKWDDKKYQALEEAQFKKIKR